jgi:hypothetical protein
MLPLPQEQLAAGKLEPALAGSSAGSTPFAGSAQGAAAFAQPAAAARVGTLLSELKGVAGSPCSSPLKRSQPSSGVFGSAEDGTASPLKRACPATAFSEQQQQQQSVAAAHTRLQLPPQSLPEPPSFATLMQAEASGEEDAIAWAAAVAASDGMKRVGDSCVSLGVLAPLGSLDSFPSAFLRLGSMQGMESMQLLSALTDVAEVPGQQGDEGTNVQAGAAP